MIRGFAAVAILGASALRNSGRQGSSAPPAAQRSRPGGRAAPSRAAQGRCGGSGRAAPPAPPPRHAVAGSGAVRCRTEPPRAVPAPARRSPRECRVRRPTPSARDLVVLDSGRLEKAPPGSSRSSQRTPTRRGLGSRWASSNTEGTGAASRSNSGGWRWPRIPRSGKTLNSAPISASCSMTPRRRPASRSAQSARDPGVPLLEQCVASAKTPRLRALATRGRDRIKSP